MSSLFTDPDGEPLRFFLPMSLTARSSFKQKIEDNGGVLVQSELMTNIIKIGDPAKPQSYDASWLNFRYIDDALREGELQNPEFYVMDNPGQGLQVLRQVNLAPTQRETPSAVSLSNGVGSRGTRMEFTPEEDDILRRIVHRPGVATSGNKIYQLIAQQYGGHSFHSWRDRYIRHMRPIWGPPTEESAMDVNATDDFILTQSYLRAPHVSASERQTPRSASIPNHTDAESVLDDSQLRKPSSPASAKKQRAAFSTTDDEILIRAIWDNGETASTYKDLGERHQHHTWESWKNRVKAIKKKHGGSLPTHEEMLRIPGLSDLTDANLPMHIGMPASPENRKSVDLLAQDNYQDNNGEAQSVVDPNIDPNLQLQQLGMIMDDPQQAYEQQFSEQAHFDPTHDLHMQQQLQAEDVHASQFEYPTTEDMLRQNLQGHAADDLELPDHLMGKMVATSERKPGLQRKRQINIHDPTIDEHAAPVSDIEDATQTQAPTKRGRKGTKKRKTNAAAQAAAARAAAQPRMTPATPHRQVDPPSASNPKSAKQEHHERDKAALVGAIRNETVPDFAIEVPTMSNKSHPGLEEFRDGMNDPELIDPSKGKFRRASQDVATEAETFAREYRPAGDADVNDDDLRAEEQIKDFARGQYARANKSPAQRSHPARGESQESRSAEPRNQAHASRPQVDAVQSTPEASPVRPPASQLLSRHIVNENILLTDGYDQVAATPESPTANPFSQSQFLQDTQAIRGNLTTLNFETSLQEIELDSQDQRRLSTLQTAAKQRRADWIARQTRQHGIPTEHAADAWHRTSGVQSLAVRVVEAYRIGQSPPRIPGVWTKEDDEILRSTNVRAMQEVDRFHHGTAETRLLFLDQQES